MFEVYKKDAGTSVFNSEDISHLVLVLLKLTLNNQMLAGVITGWQPASLLILALLFRKYLGFLTRLMALKLRNKSRKCFALNFLVSLCPPHMIPLALNTPSLTINKILQCFTHSNNIILVQ